jgi:excisionase family DNA binding protein
MSSIENVVAASGCLLTVKEVMAVLKIGRTKTYELIAAGQLEFIKFGARTTRIKADSVEKLLTHGIAV